MIPTFSPQGDGNALLPHELCSMLCPLIPTFSPQGDGNTKIPLVMVAILGYVDPYLFPARGRKLRNRLLSTPRNMGSDVDPYLFPARGRKRLFNAGLVILLVLFHC